jgi:hypothetical protein
MKSKTTKQTTILCLRYLSVAVVTMGGLLLEMQTASATTVTGGYCLADQYSGGGTPNCTSNDVRIAGVAKDAQGNYMVSPTTCTSGSTFALTATFEIVTGSKERYGIATYFDIGGDPETDGARTGFCALSVLDIPPAYELNGDFCGDTKQNETLLVPVTIPNVSCTDSDSDGKLNLPAAVSWFNNKSDQCTSVFDATAGAPSKCKLDDAFNVPVEVEKPTIGVTKDALPTECDEPGCDVIFTVHVTNPAAVVSITINKIIDDPDNDPATIDSITYEGDDLVCEDKDLAPGEETDCTFTRFISGDPGDIITDKACVHGTDSNTPPNPITPQCDTATVTIKDVIPTPTLEKTAQGGVCAVERYKVEVSNTSTIEELNLAALNDDKFGDITKTEGDIFGTTCGVASGTGTLTGQVGAGALPFTVLTSDSYICYFDALICKAELPHTNEVTGTLNDDDENTLTPKGSATVNSISVP